jgi:hypothetical protein
MLVALALYTSTATRASPPDSAECRASVRMQTSLTENQRGPFRSPASGSRKQSESTLPVPAAVYGTWPHRRARAVGEAAETQDLGTRKPRSSGLSLLLDLGGVGPCSPREVLDFHGSPGL